VLVFLRDTKPLAPTKSKILWGQGGRVTCQLPYFDIYFVHFVHLAVYMSFLSLRRKVILSVSWISFIISVQFSVEGGSVCNHLPVIVFFAATVNILRRYLSFTVIPSVRSSKVIVCFRSSVKSSVSLHTSAFRPVVLDLLRNSLLVASTSWRLNNSGRCINNLDTPALHFMNYLCFLLCFFQRIVFFNF